MSFLEPIQWRCLREIAEWIEAEDKRVPINVVQKIKKNKAMSAKRRAALRRNKKGLYRFYR